MAHELILTGEMIAAEEALRIGLVNRVTEPAELLPTAESIARKIIANAPLAVKYSMEAIERGMEMPQEEGIVFGSDAVRPVLRDRGHARGHARVS